MNGNAFHLSGKYTMGAPLGPVCGVAPIAILGHVPHVVVNFKDGGRLELDADAVDILSRRLPEARARLRVPVRPPDMSGSLADLGGEQ